MYFIQCFGSFQLDQQRFFDQQVREILTDCRAVISDCDTALGRNGETPLAWLVRQRILIHLLEKPSPKRIAYSEGAAGDSF